MSGPGEGSIQVQHWPRAPVVPGYGSREVVVPMTVSEAPALSPGEPPPPAGPFLGAESQKHILGAALWDTGSHGYSQDRAGGSGAYEARILKGSRRGGHSESSASFHRGSKLWKIREGSSEGFIRNGCCILHGKVRDALGLPGLDG